ncbi:hypothetical protein ABZ814_25865 [Micromonospora musae]|uniref:hypothetical protein n=1 Tax=Micromonospora musae TaxID=1894970 RepID=UPI0033E1FA57
MPADGEQAPVGGEQAPVGGEQAPVGGEERAGGERLERLGAERRAGAVGAMAGRTRTLVLRCQLPLWYWRST